METDIAQCFTKCIVHECVKYQLSVAQCNAFYILIAKHTTDQIPFSCTECGLILILALVIYYCIVNRISVYGVYLLIPSNYKLTRILNKINNTHSKK